jgi:hypothetical protein
MFGKNNTVALDKGLTITCNLKRITMTQHNRQELRVIITTATRLGRLKIMNTQ